VHHEGRLLDADAQAQSRQIHPGVPLSVAKAVLRDQGRYVAYREETFRQARDAWLDVCLEFSAVVEPGLAGEAWVDLSLHPDAVGTARELCSRLAAATGLNVQAGLAPGKWVARLSAALYGPTGVRRGAPLIDPVSDPGVWLAPLPTSMLEPVEPEHRERLVFLGYRRIGQVARAPWRGLKEQFGESAYKIKRAAEGRLHDPVRAAYPPESVFARVDFDHPLDDGRALEAAVDELASRIAGRLVATDRTAGALQLSLEFEHGPPTVVRRAVVKPWQTEPPLRTALRAMLGELHRQARPIAVQAVAHGLLRADRWQSGLLAIPDVAQAHARADAAARRVWAACGEGKIVQASRLTVPRRVEVLREWRRATGWR
jgi:DNA polymerase-4